MSMIALTVNQRAVQAIGGAAHPPGGFPARQPRSDRHASRLRARRLRRLHGAARRRAGALVHHLCGGLRRRRGHHDRRPRRRRRHDGAARGLHPRACAAMRLLHAGHAGLGARPRAAPAACRRAPHPRRIERQPVPLHRLCRHRAGGPVRDRSAARPRYRADAGRRAEDPGPRRLGSKRARGTDRAERMRSVGSEQTSPEAAGSVASIPDFIPATVLTQHFSVAHPPEQVFAMFGDIAAVAACLPGASLTAPPKPERVEGAIRVRIGPIAATFLGAARVERNPADMSGRIVGIGNDRRSRSSTQGEIRYRLVPIEQGTRVDLSIGYTLTGMLAQVGRPGLVRDLAARLIAEFAGNLDRRLSGTSPADSRSGRTERNGAGFRSFARAGRALAWSFLVRQRRSGVMDRRLRVMRKRRGLDCG